ncbi:glycosyl hydrolase family 28-related protein [Dysgonomonas reticulitermitis]
MKKYLLVAFLLYLLSVYTVKAAVSPFNISHSPNIVRITQDTLYLVTGTTYRFTVDTPEDKGLLSTGLTANQLGEQLHLTGYTIYDRNGKIKSGDTLLETGDRLKTAKKGYTIALEEKALSPILTVHRKEVTAGVESDIILDFVAGQRTPAATINIYIPKGINVTPGNTTVNVIGRGEVGLRDLPKQSIGRAGTNYPYRQVGQVNISGLSDGGQVVTFTDIDLRPLNGIDLQIRIKDIKLNKTGDYVFRSEYITSQPKVYKSAGTPMSIATVRAVNTITDLRRDLPNMVTYKEDPALFNEVKLNWTAPSGKIALLQSTDKGKSWSKVKNAVMNVNSAKISGLQPDKLYTFKIIVTGGINNGESNLIHFNTGKFDIKSFGVKGNGIVDDTDSINAAIKHVHSLGGGILYFTAGTYNIRTAHLRSNVWLHIGKNATLKALRGSDAPEVTWFSDKAYRSGLSPTDKRPYSDPENYLTKQDVGHTFFRNTMFFAERQENIKIFGNGRITGDGNLVTSDRVMDNEPDKRADKMFTFKLCKNIEIGGYDNGKDLWYDPATDEPYYIGEASIDNMLHIDQGGHFVLLATGSDSINVHDSYFAKEASGNARDIYDFMSCSHVIARNIYSKVSSDDIVKLGADCSLGFTRPAKDYIVRNIIGDTNCNLFQIGSETADDIQDIYVDNIYVLGSNKAGFSISTNDGGHIKNVFLNTGHTGPLHHTSKMFRTRAPFFISISNRARVIGADVEMFSFNENGKTRNELLCTNVNIGQVENIVLNNVEIAEAYAGSSFRGERWTPYDGKQNKATPIIAGYKLPDNDKVEGGLNFRLPNGEHTGYIKNIKLNNIHLTVKGGHPAEDRNASPPEIGVGKYNVGDLNIQPAFGFWFRHVKDASLKNCTIKVEQPDERYAIVMDDVIDPTVENISVPDNTVQPIIKKINK